MRGVEAIVICKRVEEQIPAYVADLLSESRRVQVARHLESCPSCRHWSAEVEQLAEALYAIEK